MSFLYTMGLEHTGHNMWALVANQAVKAGQMTYAHDTTSITLNCEVSPCDLNAMQHAMRVEIGQPTAVINSCSYPCGEPSNAHDPNVTRMVRVARIANRKPRILVLPRPVVEVVYNFDATRINRLYQSCNQMLADLNFLRQDEFMCTPYHGTPKNAPELAAFLGSNISHIIVASFKPTERQKDSYMRLRASGLETSRAWASLRACVQRIDARCYKVARARASFDITLSARNKRHAPTNLIKFPMRKASEKIA